MAIVVAWIAAIPFAAWAVIRHFGFDGGYPLEAMMPFTPYVAAAAMVAVTLALALRRWAGRQTLDVLAANAHRGARRSGGPGRPRRRRPFLLGHRDLLALSAPAAADSVHPFPPTNPTVTDEWEKVLSMLPSGGHGTPWLLAGDFNATFDQAPFRELVARGYHDAGEVAGKGLDATFPADGSLLPPPITIDHILADDRFGIVEYEVEPLPGSDHHAIFARLALPDSVGD